MFTLASIDLTNIHRVHLLLRIIIAFILCSAAADSIMIFPRRTTTLIALASIATVAHGISPEELQAKLRETIINPMSHSANGRELAVSESCINETADLLATNGPEFEAAQQDGSYQAVCAQAGGQMVTINYESTGCADAAMNMKVDDLPIACAAASCDLGEYAALLQESLLALYELVGDLSGCTFSLSDASSDGFLPAAAAASIAASMAVLDFLL